MTITAPSTSLTDNLRAESFTGNALLCVALVRLFASIAAELNATSAAGRIIQHRACKSSNQWRQQDSSRLITDAALWRPFAPSEIDSPSLTCWTWHAMLGVSLYSGLSRKPELSNRCHASQPRRVKRRCIRQRPCQKRDRWTSIEGTGWLVCFRWQRHR